MNNKTVIIITIHNGFITHLIYCIKMIQSNFFCYLYYIIYISLRTILKKLGIKMSRNKSYYKLCKTLGLSTRDINKVLKNRITQVAPTYLDAGPKPYSGGFYGSISIYDF